MILGRGIDSASDGSRARIMRRAIYCPGDLVETPPEGFGMAMPGILKVSVRHNPRDFHTQRPAGKASDPATDATPFGGEPFTRPASAVDFV
jgi:hypothetical protein